MFQVPDQPLGGDAGHDVVNVVYASTAVVPERIGEGVGDFGRSGGTGQG